MMHDEEFLNEAITAYSNSKGIHSLLLELRERRRAEKDNASISARVDDKNATQAICEPLKELIELREQNKALKNFAAGQAATISRLQDELRNSEIVPPMACTKFMNSTAKEWMAKLNEEVAEVIEAIYDPQASRDDMLREMVDVATVIRSMEYASGFSKQKINEMQLWVNAHNRERGYMEASEK